MKIVWMAGLAAVAMSGAAWSQSTIYKHVDDSGRVTYSNKPMKGATVVDLEPLTTIPGTPSGSLQPHPAAPVATKAVAKVEVLDRAEKAAAPVMQPTLAAIEPQVQRKRDNDRRRILEEELTQEESSLNKARESITQEQQNPQLIAAVRAMQQANEPTPAQMVAMRNDIEKASGRIRGLQATVAEHEKNIEALKKELGALKP
jgi:hypothetical protein